ncbi:DUF2971 domain-containing protein [Maricaulis sp.]|uniref:DUF2971 domain-containing protein n=1 Tax=Maricaulis sp. TaxID=1486257 RepID=UPI003A8F65AF
MKKLSDRVLHFTNGAGFLGIIEGDHLRATHFEYTNDSSELRSYLDAISRLSLNSDVEADSDNLIEEKDGKIIVTLSQTNWQILQLGIVRNPDQFLNAYLTSFCKIQNMYQYYNGLLSQWRGYSNDGGYALEFFKDEIINKLQGLSETESFSFTTDVKYVDNTKIERELQKSFYKTASISQRQSILDKNLFDMGPFNLNDKRSVIGLAGIQVALQVMKSCLQYKNLHFSEENEWRVGSFHMKPLDEGSSFVNFYNRGGTLTPYLRILAGKTCKLLRRVVVGPHPQQGRRIRSAEMLLAKHGCKAKVSGSSIPFTRLTQ